MDSPSSSERDANDCVDRSADDRHPLSAMSRTVLTMGLLFYLGIVALGPLSNPIGSEHLTAPLASEIRPIHEALYLNHGYRFFGPDPGPSHILEYRIEGKGLNSEAQFRWPDRDTHWPRLLYHRWFMLSETLYRECSTIPSAEDHRQWLLAITQDIESYRAKGEMPSMNQLIRQRELRQQNYDSAVQRRDLLLRAIGKHLLTRHSGDAVELYLLERLIPRPFDIQSGVKLTDPRFLSEPRFIGRFTSEQLDSKEDLP